MLKRDEWLDLARKLDWDYSYVSERDVFPEEISGSPWLPHVCWEGWDEPYRTSYVEYVSSQHDKDAAIHAVRDAVGQVRDFERHDRAWLSALKLHGATLPLAEFAAVIGNLRAVRFARDSAWRTTANLGALDELRHTQIPLLVLHELVRWDAQFDWTHKLFHTDDWVAVAARHLVDELLLTANPIEFAIATNFVFETGFTNLQFVGLSSIARSVGDRMFEKMVQSIQTDEARHSQIGGPVLRTVVEQDPAYAQYLVDKWFWRTWLFFSIVSGFAMDYLTPLEHRRASFKEFVEEWILDHFEALLAQYGLSRPWYWNTFIESIGRYHHMVYASAYTHRATVWFDLALPGPAERAWLQAHYPDSWPLLDPVWERITARCRQAGPDFEWYTQGATPIGFCRLCQLVLCGGSPLKNSAVVHEHAGQRYVFCSEPCAWIFAREPARYAQHQDIVQRILAGAAPGNLFALIRAYFGLTEQTQGKDVARGRYAWLEQRRRPEAPLGV